MPGFAPPKAPNKKPIDLAQLAQPPRERSAILEDRIREQTFMDTPPGSPQRRHLENGGKVSDLPNVTNDSSAPGGAPSLRKPDGGYPIGGPTRDGGPGFFEKDPRNPHGSKHEEVKHNIEVERQKEAELSNTAGTKPAMPGTQEKKAQASTPTGPASTAGKTRPMPGTTEEPKQDTTVDAPAAVQKEESPAPAPAITTPKPDEQKQAAQEFKDKRTNEVINNNIRPMPS